MTITEAVGSRRCAPVVLPVDGEVLSIAEVAERTGVGAHALRYYERIGLLDVPRDAAGRRRYGAFEVQRIFFISRLRASQMPIRDLQAYFALVEEGPGNEAGRLAILEHHRDEIEVRIAELHDALDVVHMKIAMYGG
jgi:DNA-binding transcriptional MerR regulator